MENDLENYINSEKNYRTANQPQNSLYTCLQILKLLKTQNSNNQYNTISKILLHKSQFLLVVFGVYKEIFSDETIIKNEETKNTYFNLLHQILKKVKDSDANYIQYQNKLLDLFAENNYAKIFEEIQNIKIPNEQLISSFDSSGLASSKNNFMVMTNQGLLQTQSNVADSPRTQEELNKGSKADKKVSELKTLENKITVKQNVKMNYKIDNTLPMILLSVNATLNSNQIIDLICNIFYDFDFTQINSYKRNELEITFVFEKVPNKVLNFFCCKKHKTTQLQVTILLHDKINTRNENKYERKIQIRSIMGKESSIEKTIIKFLKQLVNHLTKIQILRKSKNFNNYNFEEFISNNFKRKLTRLNKGKSLPQGESSFSYSLGEEQYQNEKDLIDISIGESGKVFDIYKILSSENYSLGKSLSEFLANFKTKYENHKDKSPSEIKTKEIMNEITEQIGECLQTFTNSFNLNKNSINNSNEKENTRQAIEQYIFNKLYFFLIEIYQKKYNEDDAKFAEQQKIIKNSKSVDDIYNDLEIKKKFRGTDKIPFQISIELINKLEFEQSPKKKFEILTQANLELRNYILDISKGKVELDSMDDELPITIYLATQIKTKDLIAQLNLLDDYLKCTLKDDLFQNKMITNLLSAARYITYSWEEK